jgi:hypothetical protein
MEEEREEEAVQTERKHPHQVLHELQAKARPALKALGVPPRRMGDWWWIGKNLTKKKYGSKQGFEAARKAVDEINKRRLSL